MHIKTTDVNVQQLQFLKSFLYEEIASIDGHSAEYYRKSLNIIQCASKEKYLRNCVVSQTINNKLNDTKYRSHSEKYLAVYKYICDILDNIEIS